MQDNTTDLPFMVIQYNAMQQMQCIVKLCLKHNMVISEKEKGSTNSVMMFIAPFYNSPQWVFLDSYNSYYYQIILDVGAILRQRWALFIYII